MHEKYRVINRIGMKSFKELSQSSIEQKVETSEVSSKSNQDAVVNELILLNIYRTCKSKAQHIMDIPWTQRFINSVKPTFCHVRPISLWVSL